MELKKLLNDLDSRRKQALKMGGPEKIKRQHAQGKWTARERIAKLDSERERLQERLDALGDEPSTLSRCAHLLTSLTVVTRDAVQDSATWELPAASMASSASSMSPRSAIPVDSRSGFPVAAA